MFDSIIFLTSRYPYENGEDFIGNEISYMLDSCKKLYIIPLNARNFTNCRIEKAERIEIWEENNFTPKVCKIMYAPFQICDINIIKECFKLKQNGKINKQTMELLFYFSVQYKLKSRKIVKWLLEKIKNEEKVLIYSYWLYDTAYVGCLLKKYFNSSIIVTRAHGFDIYLERNKNNYLPLHDFTVSNMDYIFPISNDGKVYLKRQYPQKNNIITYRLGTLLYGINPDANNDFYTIISCSNIIPVKRCEKIIDILKNISDIPIKWIHFGDGEQKKYLQDQAKKELPTNIQHSIDGAISNKELMRYYKNNHVDIFINVSESEGIPVSIMEALSFGIPVIATDVGGTSEIVKNKINGFLINKDFVDAEVANLIRSLLLNKDEMYRKRARQVWSENYCADKNYKAFYEFLQQSAIGDKE